MKKCEKMGLPAGQTPLAYSSDRPSPGVRDPQENALQDTADGESHPNLSQMVYACFRGARDGSAKKCEKVL